MLKVTQKLPSVDEIGVFAIYFSDQIMKLASLLRKLKLYEPARKVADYCIERFNVTSLRIKRYVYYVKLKRYRSSAVYSQSRLKVLVVNNSGGIGNSIEGTPVVQAIRSLWPGAQITVVSPHGDLFEQWCVPDYITDTVEDVRGKSFDHSFFAYTFLSAIFPWKEICDLGEVHHPRVWLRKYFLKPERQYLIDMLKPLGYKGPVPPLYVSVKKPAIDIKPSDLRICLIPGAKNEPKWKNKRWPYYSELSEMILASYPDAQIYVIGTKEDYFPAEALDNPRIIDLRSRLTLAETAWVLKNAHLAVGNDCGPMHIAYAVQTPSLAIFGPTCQIKNAPCNKAVAISCDLPCRPCQYSDIIETCQDPRCMKEITPRIVMDKVEQILLTRNKE